MSLLKSLTPSFITQRYMDFKRRLDRLELSVKNLETALDGILVKPKYIPGDEVGFNGQRERKRIFEELNAIISFDAAVETGTWLGETAGYIANTTRKPVYSCELNSRFHALAKMRLADVRDAHLERSDSRTFLRNLAKSSLVTECVFFYLDAHWYDDLPLVEEIQIVAVAWSRWVVMIDDFKVPEDPGYGYDSYGGGRALALDLIEPVRADSKLTAYFPTARSADETGPKRGCVVLAPTGEISNALATAKSLRPWV